MGPVIQHIKNGVLAGRSGHPGRRVGTAQPSRGPLEPTVSSPRLSDCQQQQQPVAGAGAGSFILPSSFPSFLPLFSHVSSLSAARRRHWVPCSSSFHHRRTRRVPQHLSLGVGAPSPPTKCFDSRPQERPQERVAMGLSSYIRAILRAEFPLISGRPSERWTGVYYCIVL